MNKKLVALAVAGAVASPLAAQAQTANVTLYGRLNVDYEFVQGRQADGSNKWINRLSSNSSRFGLKGEESLGRGMKAIFQIESSISGDNGGQGGTTLAGRDTFVGLNGNFGTVRFGRFLMPLDDLHGIFGNNPTYLTSVLSTASIWVNGAVAKNNNGTGNAQGFDDRVANSIRWDSPNFGGFTTGIQYGTQENGRRGYSLGINGIYKAGPFQIGAAWEQDKDYRCSPRGAACDTNDQAASVAGSWNFGIGTVAAVWDRTKYKGTSSGTSANFGSLKRDFWGVSGTFNLGPGKLYAFFGDAGDWKGNSGSFIASNISGSSSGPSIPQVFRQGNDSGGMQYEVSYTYDLSKRTSVYAGYVRIQNDSRSQYTFNINAYPVAPGGDPQAVVFGMIHLF